MVFVGVAMPLTHAVKDRGPKGRVLCSLRTATIDQFFRKFDFSARAAPHGDVDFELRFGRRSVWLRLTAVLIFAFCPL
jgi:hypothetical protein